MNPLAYTATDVGRMRTVPSMPSSTAADVQADAVTRDPEGRRLAAACVAGDAAARRQLQELLWPLIAELIRANGGPQHSAEPGELLAYALEDDRVYRRLRTYAGRVSLRSYLLKYVLRHLLLQMISRRERTTIKTVPIDDVSVEDTVEHSETTEPLSVSSGHVLRTIFARLSDERRVLLKLLHIEDFELDEDERALLARRGKCSPGAIDAAIERARSAVREREGARRARLEHAALVARSIAVHAQRLAEIDARLRAGADDEAITARLKEAHTARAAKLAWRRRQQQALLDEGRRTPVNLPYKDIAALMNMPIGTVTSELTRIRRELRRWLAQQQEESNPT